MTTPAGEPITLKSYEFSEQPESKGLELSRTVFNARPEAFLESYNHSINKGVIISKRALKDGNSLVLTRDGIFLTNLTALGKTATEQIERMNSGGQVVESVLTAQAKLLNELKNFDDLEQKTTYSTNAQLITDSRGGGAADTTLTWLNMKVGANTQMIVEILDQSVKTFDPSEYPSDLADMLEAKRPSL